MAGLLELFHGSLGQLVMFCQCEDQEGEDWAGHQGGQQAPGYQQANTGRVWAITLFLRQELGLRMISIYRHILIYQVTSRTSA